MVAQIHDVSARLPEERGAFGGFIGPKNLIELVRITAPWLFDGSCPRFADPPAGVGTRLHERAAGPLGWWSVLRSADLVLAAETPTVEQRTDYFALCLAAHFGSVATYVPTDVDTKIRDRLWFSGQPLAEAAIMRKLALGLASWDISSVSARIIKVEGHAGVSGHDGERLSVLSAGMLSHLARNERDGAAELEEAVDAELAREAAAFTALSRQSGRERELLCLAATLTHNAGDTDQGLNARGGADVGATQKLRFGRLAHERRDRYGGAFGRAADLYRDIMAAEGHRHYPLREVKALRRHPDLLLPLGPFLDDWGALVARHPSLTHDDRADVVAALVTGCSKVKGQVGYYRALVGFESTFPRGFDSPELVRRLPASVRRDLRDAAFRRALAVRRESFEASLAKQARARLQRA